MRILRKVHLAQLDPYVYINLAGRRSALARRSENDGVRAIPDQGERRPKGRWAIGRGSKIIEFRLSECGGFVLTLRQVRVESLHQRSRRRIVNFPQRSDHTLGAREQESFRQSIDPLFTFELSVRRIAS